jgi:hypothetical protein
MKAILSVFLILLHVGCTSTLAKKDIAEISIKGKSVEEIKSSVEKKGYRCNAAEPTKYESEHFLKAGYEIVKYTCVKQTNSLFCVNTHFIDIFQDVKTRQALYLNAQAVPTCIWH